jgi:hypothetical protein
MDPFLQAGAAGACWAQFPLFFDGAERLPGRRELLGWRVLLGSRAFFS